MYVFSLRFLEFGNVNFFNSHWLKQTIKGEVQSRITIISKERVKISLQIGAKIMKIG